MGIFQTLVVDFLVDIPEAIARLVEIPVILVQHVMVQVNVQFVQEGDIV